MKPFIIGIAGGSGSGKSTVARAVAAALDTCVIVDHDAYYREQSHLTMEQRREVNFDHPDSLDNALLVQHLQALVRGESFEKPTYDFANHTRADARVTVAPCEVVIVDGILILADPALRGLFDLKVFVDVPDDLRFIRRLERDVSERGRDMGDVIRQYISTVRPMHLEYVAPSMRFADVVITDGGFNAAGIAAIVDRVSPSRGARPLL